MSGHLSIQDLSRQLDDSACNWSQGLHFESWECSRLDEVTKSAGGHPKNQLEQASSPGRRQTACVQPIGANNPVLRGERLDMAGGQLAGPRPVEVEHVNLPRP